MNTVVEYHKKTAIETRPIIHVVLGKANPNRMNGVNKVVHQLATAQHEADLHVQVWGITNDLNPTYPDRPFSTSLFLPSRSLRGISAPLREMLNKTPTDTIFHLHGAFIPFMYRFAKYLKQHGYDYVFTPHGSYAQEAMKKSKLRKRLYFRIYEKSLVQNAKVVQLLGINEYHDAEKLWATDNKILISNGLSLDDIPYQSTKTCNPKPIFGFCGRVDTYHKGLDLLLEGFAIFRKEGYVATLEIIGDGADRPDLEALTMRLGIQDDVVFHGKQFGADKFAILNRFDLFLHTSRMEGFPMAVLEAAALGIPCMTSPATNINAFIKRFDAGYPYEINEPSVIAQQLKQVTNDMAQNKLCIKGQHARQMVEQEFKWSHIAKLLNVEYVK